MATSKSITFTLLVHDSMNMLSSQERNLMELAVTARKKAYAPYSKFNVGAAVLLENGEVVLGNNQENASYPSGLCAERVAIFYAGANFPGVKVKAIAITAASSSHQVATPAAPCGNCRQAIAEYEYKQDSPIKLYLMGETGSVVECGSLSDLLPLGFNSSFLK